MCLRACAAIRSIYAPAPPRNGRLHCEKDWNETSTLQDEPYSLSKVMAERTAWALAREHGIHLVTILPRQQPRRQLH